jgi:selenocysteine-specific elongation factor
VTGRGIDELRRELERQAKAVRLKDEALPPRLPIDRVFTLRGIGTVATGTLWSGSIENTDQLEILPRGRTVRIRALQVHDSDRQTVYAGERVAVNLAGVSTGEVSRGDVLTAPGCTRPTYMLDARVSILRDWVRPLKRGTRLRFHHGTREVLGRIYPLDVEKIDPGEELGAQLRLEVMVVCAPGDRFVLRSYSPVTTIGGGTVVDAHPIKHKVRDPVAVAEFGKLEAGDPASSVAVYLARVEKPVSAEELTFASGLPPRTADEGLKRLEAEGTAIAFGNEKSRAYLHKDHYQEAAERVKSTLDEFHRMKPLADGMAKETLKKKALASWDTKSAEVLIDNMTREGAVETDGKTVRLAGSTAATTSDQQNLIEDAVARIASNPVSPPTLSELAAELGGDKGMLSELLTIAEKENRVIRISPELFFSPAAVADIEDKLREAIGPGGITVSDFKNVIGTSRKYALPLLEYFDRVRVTARVGDLRKLR